MLKSYNELRKIDVRPYCDVRKEGKEEIAYLNWAKCIDLLHQNGAEKVFFEPIPLNNGSSLISSNIAFKDKYDTENRAYETRIKITIDDDVFEFQGPVMNGSNPVKDNSMSQQRLWNCQCRLFVKAVAIHTGLGFDLWVKNEDSESREVAQTYTHDIRKVKEQVNQLITAIQKESSMSLSDIAEKMNRTEAELKTWIRQYDILYAFEHNLEVILKGVINDKKS